MTVEEWLGKENTLGKDIWERKYRYNGESFDEWIVRVSGGDEDVARLIREKKFLFGGRILAGRGIHGDGRKVTLSNCYVTDVKDSIEGIYEAAAKIARTFSYGGGIGVDISTLAPNGAEVHNAAKTSSGAVSFMDLFSLTTGLIGQNGRRGALMISMSCDHPDIEEFIDVKNDLDKVTFANISVRASDDFMRAAIDGEDYTLRFKREETGEVIEKKVNARRILHKIAENNWRTGEPGMLFWDTICGYNLQSDNEKFSYSGVNPCAEEPLPTGGSCLLGSMNLSEYVEPYDGTQYSFNRSQFSHDVRIAVTALNKVLEEGLELHPLEEQKECVRKWRQIGLGIMGLGDALIKLGIRYGSKDATLFCSSVGFLMINSALQQSALIAKEMGTYTEYDENAVANSYFFINNTTEETRNIVKSYGLRNSQLLTTAPTGTLSTMLGISGGIEPIFANSYTRTTKSLHGEDVDYKVYTPIVKEYMDSHHLTSEDELPEFFVTAQNIPYEERISMQSALQTYIDASISSTINLPNSATVEDIENIYIKAWEAGLKGVTVFRDGCERVGILNTSQKEVEDQDVHKRGFVRKVGNDAIGLERHLTTGCGSLHCSAFFDPKTGELLETYLSKGSQGGCLSSLTGLSRMISIAARGGVSVDDIVDQLLSTVSCPSYAVRRATKKDTSTGDCCPSAVGRAIKEMSEEIKGLIGENRGILAHSAEKADDHDDAVSRCPECGEELVFEGGCVVCKCCGYSKC